MTDEEIKKLIDDRDDYKRRFDEFCNLSHKLTDSFLGNDYYVPFSCGEPQASEYLFTEILNKYDKEIKNHKKAIEKYKKRRYRKIRPIIKKIF